MKYIRTKDGIINYDRAIHNIKFWCSEHCYNYYFTRKELKKFEESIKNCKQADTIEELCDGWILESEAYTSGFFVIYNTKDNKQIMKNFKLLKDEKLFAFIKTDKGLIYVAKTNEKGELELL